MFAVMEDIDSKGREGEGGIVRCDMVHFKEMIEKRCGDVGCKNQSRYK
jgi:hypothetical protein